MTHTPTKSRFITTAIFAASLSLTLSACKKNAVADTVRTPVTTPVSGGQTETFPPISDALECLRETGPIISQHRGRSKDLKHPDNSMIALKALRSNGYIMAEIDIAGLKDGTQILYHDGVWDEKSTGQGPVASSDSAYAETILLKNYKGNISSERPPKFTEVLEWADQRLYLEIDFKSSAKTDKVIDQIRAANMQDHVALIVYNKEDAKAFADAGMMVAVPVSKMSDIRDYEAMGLTRDHLLAWTGTKDYNPRLISKLENAGVRTAFGMMSPKYADPADYTGASMLVTDYSDEAKRDYAKTRGTDAARLKACRLN